MEKNKEIDSTEVDEEAALFINKNIEEIPEEELALKILFVSINPQKNNQSAIKEEKILLIPRNHINPVIFPFDFLSIDNGDYTNKKPTTFNFKVVHDEKRPFYSDDLEFFKNSKDGRWIEWCNHQGQTLILFRPFFKTKPDLDDYFCYDGCNKKCWISLGCPFLKFSRWPNITVSLRVSVVAQYLLGFFSELLSLRLPCEEEFGATGFSVGLVSTKNHQLEYDLTLLETTDLLSGNLRLGNLSLLSSLYYKFTIDERDSILRPTQGYAVQSATTISGLLPDGWSARFLRQEFHMCYALPLDYKNAALNLGFSGGLMLPWSKSCVNRPLFPPRANKIFLSENSSVFGFMGGLDSLWSLRYRGVHGPNIGMQTRDDSSSSLINIALDGDLAFSAFADLSFDLPVKVLRDKGIYGHVFASAGSVLKLKEIKPNNFSLRNLMESFRTSVKCGIVLPIENRYNMEVNICHIMERSFNQIESKFGLQLCFSILRPQMVTLTAKKK